MKSLMACPGCGLPREPGDGSRSGEFACAYCDLVVPEAEHKLVVKVISRITRKPRNPNPARAGRLYDDAEASFADGAVETAIDLIASAIEADPEDRRLWHRRTRYELERGDSSLFWAVQEETDASRLAIDQSPREAIDRCRRAQELDPGYTWATARMARILAVSTDPSVRDGKRAVELTVAACESGNWNCVTYLQILAWGLAECRYFALATKVVKRALLFARPDQAEGLTSDHARCEMRLTLVDVLGRVRGGAAASGGQATGQRVPMHRGDLEEALCRYSRICLGLSLWLDAPRVGRRGSWLSSVWLLHDESTGHSAGVKLPSYGVIEPYVRSMVAKDWLSIIVAAIEMAPGELNAPAIAALAAPAARAYAAKAGYEEYADFRPDQLEDLVEQFRRDRSLSGFRSETTFLGGFLLCAALSGDDPKKALLTAYLDLVENLLETVADAVGWTEEIREFGRSLRGTFRGLCEGGIESIRAGHRPYLPSASLLGKEPATISWARREADQETNLPLTDPSGRAPAPPDAPAPRGREIAATQATGALVELEALVGLRAVKTEIRKLAAYLAVQSARRKLSVPVARQTLHFVFRGNPGTGKTTVARLLGQILQEFGVLNSANFVECSREDLVAGYVGQTAIKTQKRISEALDGVLFIDEAYQLKHRQEDSFGEEAIGTLIKQMEDHRDRLVVIVAGYPRRMDQFLQSNPGLRSRFTRFIDFEDYDADDLCRIFVKFCADSHYFPTAGCRAEVATLLSLMHSHLDESFGNAREVRNLFEEVVALQSDRLITRFGSAIPGERLIQLEGQDVPLMAELIGIGRRRGSISSEALASAMHGERLDRVCEELRAAGVQVRSGGQGGGPHTLRLDAVG